MGRVRDRDKEIFRKLFGQKIKQLRESQGLSQTELAQRCYTDRQHIFKIENGDINPTAYLLYLIAKACGENIDFLSLHVYPGQDKDPGP